MEGQKINSLNSKDDWPIVAICYDFDKTLSPQDMQNIGLIPKLKCKVEEFWSQSNGMAKEHKMDKILMYMKLITDKAGACCEKITREDFNLLGKDITLFPGVESWFERINNIAKSLEIKVEHYIISAGLKEIIEGTSIANCFTGIYASEFYYDEYGKPVWPCQVVNYTTKTQYLFRINKNCLDLGDEDSVNQYIDKDERRIPFYNFIYIGDSETDIPAMKIVKQGGGTSIGVYNPEYCDLERVKKLLKHDRINYFAPADYTKHQKLEKLVECVLNNIHAKHKLKQLSSQQMTFVDDLETLNNFVRYTQNYISEDDLSIEGIKGIESQAKKILKKIKDKLIKEYVDNVKIVGLNEIESSVNQTQKLLKKTFDAVKKKNNELPKISN